MTTPRNLAGLRSRAIRLLEKRVDSMQGLVAAGVVGSMSPRWSWNPDAQVADLDLIFETDGSAAGLRAVEAFVREALSTDNVPSNHMTAAVMRGPIRLFAPTRPVPRLFLHVRVLEPTAVAPPLLAFSWSKYSPSWGSSRWLGVPTRRPLVGQALDTFGGIRWCETALSSARIVVEQPAWSDDQTYAWENRIVDLDADWYTGAEFVLYAALHSTRNALRALGADIELMNGDELVDIARSYFPARACERLSLMNALKRSNRVGVWPIVADDWLRTRDVALQLLAFMTAALEPSLVRG